MKNTVKIFITLICLFLLLFSSGKVSAVWTPLGPNGSAQDAVNMLMNDVNNTGNDLTYSTLLQSGGIDRGDQIYMDNDQQVNDLIQKYNNLSGRTSELDNLFQNYFNDFKNNSVEYLNTRQQLINNGATHGDTTEANNYANAKYHELIRTADELSGNRVNQQGATNEALQQSQQDAVQAAQQAAADAQKAVTRCSKLRDPFLHPWNCIVLPIIASIGTLITKIVGTLLWLAALVFDLAIYISIVKFRDLINIPGVSTAWRIVRDLANLSFIFILLYIAIGKVFNISSIANNATRLIVNIIIIALLVNFSGFFVRIAVDASNVVAYEFYNRMSYDQEQNSTLVLNHNIGTALVSKLSLLNNIIPPEQLNGGTAQALPTNLGFMSIIVGTLGNVIIILVASFVLLAAALLFITRTIVLLFVYILSPLALTAYALPSFKSYFDKWFNYLKNQCLFAPLFLIPLYIVFLILGNGISLMGDTVFGAGSTLTKSGAGMALLQAMIIAMIFSCLIIAKNFSAVGSQKISGWGKALGWAGAGAAGAYTIGYAANRLAKSQAVQNLAARSKVGMGVRNTLSYVGNAGFGTGAKGYQAKVEARQERQKKRTESFKGPGAGERKTSYLNRLWRSADRDALYKSLPAEDRATLDRDLRSSGRATEADRLSATLRGKEQIETARERTKAQRMEEAVDNLTTGPIPVPTNIFNPAWVAANPTEAARVTSFRNLTGAEFTDFSLRTNLFDGAHTDLYPYLTNEQLRNVLSSGTVSRATRDTIRGEIETHRGATPHPDRSLEQAYQYLNDPTRGGDAF